MHDLVSFNGLRRQGVGRPDAYTTNATRIYPAYRTPAPDHREDRIVEQREE